MMRVCMLGGGCAESFTISQALEAELRAAQNKGSEASNSVAAMSVGVKPGTVGAASVVAAAAKPAPDATTGCSAVADMAANWVATALSVAMVF